MYSGEGTDLGATSGDAYDLAGNAGSGSIDGIHIDRQAPHTSASGVPSSWVNGDVTLTLSGTDDRSGVAATYYSVDGSAPQVGTAVTVSADGVNDVAYWSVDRAGNVETPKHDTIRVDKQIQPALARIEREDLRAAQGASVGYTCTHPCPTSRA